MPLPFAVFRPYGVLVMPQINMVVEIGCGLLLHLQRFYTVLLHFLDTLQSIFDLDLVLHRKYWHWVRFLTRKRTDGKAHPCPQFPRGPTRQGQSADSRDW